MVSGSISNDYLAPSVKVIEVTSKGVIADSYNNSVKRATEEDWGDL